jgi:hypothetical protein
MYKNMYFYMSLFVAVLFFVLTPGVLLRLPPGGSKLMVAAVHAVVFAVVYGLVSKTVMDMLYPEGFSQKVITKTRYTFNPFQRWW